MIKGKGNVFYMAT